MAGEVAGNTTASGERVVPEGYSAVVEGQATILQKGKEVFYNPVQVVNRDMSIAVLRQFVETHREERQQVAKSGNRRQKAAAAAAAARAAAQATQQAEESKDKDGAQEAQQAEGPKDKDGARGGGSGTPGGVRVLEAMAASGLRAIRYAKEVEGLSRVDANDLDKHVVEAMAQNVEFNGAQGIVRPQQGDCRMVMLQAPGRYHVVDLDPYGSPHQLLDSAVQAVASGGLLMVTATDMAVLSGSNSEACWAKYGVYPLHRPYCHEQALRILLSCIQAHANRSKRYIQPLLSLSIDFYVRVFVRVYESPAVVKESASHQSYVWQSSGCDSFYLQRVGRKLAKGNGFKFIAGNGPAVPQVCPETGSGFLMGGPMWSEPLHDLEWVAAIRKSVEANKHLYPAYDRIRSLLLTVSEELPDCPLYLDLHSLCRTLHVPPPRADTFKSALVNAGYRVSSTHCNPHGVKTDAPWSVVWDVMRCWAAQRPVGKKLDPDSYGGKLLAKQPEVKADFSRASQAVSTAKRTGQARFLPNPEPNWGPKSKHKRHRTEEGVVNEAEGEQQQKEEEEADEPPAAAEVPMEEEEAVISAE